MQDEDQKYILDNMAWDDIGWHIHGVVDEDKVFTRNELADMVIRCFDMAYYCGFDLEMTILERHEFNKWRPYKHRIF